MPWPFTTSHSWVVRLVGIPRILATVSACRKVSPSSTQFIRRMLSTSFFFSSRRRHTRLQGDWSSDVCSSDLSAWQCLSALAFNLSRSFQLATTARRRAASRKRRGLFPFARSEEGRGGEERRSRGGAGH